jgi:hypothetical protein
VRELIAAVDVGGSIGFNDFIEFYTPDERRSIALERRIPGAVEHAMFAHAREFTVTPTEGSSTAVKRGSLSNWQGRVIT